MTIVNRHEKQHLVLLDLARFLAALAVMVYHLCYWRNGEIPTETYDYNNLWWFGWVGVQIFFLLSGYVIAFSASNATPVSFAKSRFLRLVLTIWVCATITLFCSLIFGSYTDISTLFFAYLNTLVINPIGVHIDIVYWTLTVEFAFYLMVFLTLRLFGSPSLIPIMIFIGLSSSAYNLTVILLDFNFLNSVNYTLAFVAKLHHMRLGRLLLLEHGVFFSVGVLLWHLSTKPKNKLFILSLVCVFLLICTLTVANASTQYISYHNAVGVFYWSPIIVWLVGVLLISIAEEAMKVRCLNTSCAKSFFRMLGLLTYPLYLLHNNVGLMILTALSIHMISSIAAITAILACIALSIIVLYFIESFFSKLFRYIWELGVAKTKKFKIHSILFGA